MTNILLTSVGRRTYLIDYFMKAMAGAGEVHASNSIETLATQEADFSFISPLIHDNLYITTLLKYCEKSSINAILSLFDIDLLMFAKHRKTFAEIGVLFARRAANVFYRGKSVKTTADCDDQLDPVETRRDAALTLGAFVKN